MAGELENREVMDDAFAMLGLARRAWLEPADVRAAFQRAGSAVHPDGGGAGGSEGGEGAAERAGRTAEFAARNTAHATLVSTARRLRHLLALEYPAIDAPKTGTVMDDAMLHLFSTVTAAVHAASAARTRRRDAASALARALAAPAEMEAREAIDAATRAVDDATAAMEDELRRADALRDEGADASAVLMSCAARAGFLEKWRTQLREAFAGLLGA